MLSVSPTATELVAFILAVLSATILRPPPPRREPLDPDLQQAKASLYDRVRRLRNLHGKSKGWSFGALARHFHMTPIGCARPAGRCCHDVYYPFVPVSQKIISAGGAAN